MVVPPLTKKVVKKSTEKFKRPQSDHKILVKELPPQVFETAVRLHSVPPVQFLSSSPDLSLLAREALEHIFFSLVPYCPKPIPLDHLLASKDFDAEQIWQQIELQSRPLVSVLCRDVRRLEKTGTVELLANGVEQKGKLEKDEEEETELKAKNNSDEVGDDEEEDDGDHEERDGNNIPNKSEDLEKREEDGGGSEQEDEDEDYDEDAYLIENEYNPIGEDQENKDSDAALLARYDDFWQSGKPSKNQTRRMFESLVESVSDSEDDESPGESDAYVHQTDDEDGQDNETLSKYEKHQKELKSKIEQMEKENLGLKPWTMLGEVTAAKRPKNSALEVDLDFEHNKGRPVISADENIADIEDIILRRIKEGNLDEVQRASKLPSSKPPKELKELDDTKSKKGLAEIYEEEYAQKSGLMAAPLSFSDEQKKEASSLFKRLCLKLDALSHFHFAPKPVIEDMSIQANVPALAMEEVAPIAVSEAAMLAPEEIFSGKGDFKEEKELTQVDRKRRRAKIKRKFKAVSAKREFKRPRGNENMKGQKTEEDA